MCIRDRTRTARTRRPATNGWGWCWACLLYTSGAGVLFGATGGYLLGYLAAALLFWGLTAKLGQTLPVMASAMVLGLVLCYAFGTFWFLTVYTGGSGETLLGALTLCVFPYVLPDLGKIFLALVLVSRVKKHLAL